MSGSLNQQHHSNSAPEHSQEKMSPNGIQSNHTQDNFENTEIPEVEAINRGSNDVFFYNGQYIEETQADLESSHMPPSLFPKSQLQLTQPTILETSELHIHVGPLTLSVEADGVQGQIHEASNSSNNWTGNMEDFSSWEDFKEEMFQQKCSEVWSMISNPEVATSTASGSSVELSDPSVVPFAKSVKTSLLQAFPEATSFASNPMALHHRLHLVSQLQSLEFLQELPEVDTGNTTDSSNSEELTQLQENSTAFCLCSQDLPLAPIRSNSNRSLNDVDLQTFAQCEKEVDQFLKHLQKKHNIITKSSPLSPENDFSEVIVPSEAVCQKYSGSPAEQYFPIFKGLVRSPKAKSKTRNEKLFRSMYNNNKNLPFLKIKRTDVSCLGVKLDYGTYVGDSISLLNVPVRCIRNTYKNAATEKDNEPLCRGLIDPNNPEYQNLFPAYYRQKYTRNIFLLIGSIDNIFYYKSAIFGIDQPYEPEYYRIETDENGDQMSETLSGCCAYCKTVKFLPFKNSSYLSHMALEHGIYSSSYMTPDWRNLGHYTRIDPNTGIQTSMEAIQCALCAQLIDTTGWSSKKNKMLGYFRHFKLKHSTLTGDKKCANQYPPVKLRGRTSYLGPSTS